MSILNLFIPGKLFIHNQGYLYLQAEKGGLGLIIVFSDLPNLNFFKDMQLKHNVIERNSYALFLYKLLCSKTNNGVFITSVVVRNEYFLHEGINDGAIAHHLFTRAKNIHS